MDRQITRFSSTLNALLNNLASTGKGYKQALAICTDFALAAMCLWAAYSLRHGMPFSDFRSTWHIFALLPFATVVIFGGLGVYRWVIRSANQRLFRQLFKGACLSALALVLLFYFLPADRNNSRSLFVIYGMLLFCSAGGVRVLWRTLLDSDGRGEPVAIYGAGSGGQQLVSLLSSGQTYHPVMFIDDNPRLKRSTFSGLPIVAGDSGAMVRLLKRLEVGKVILAMPGMGSADCHRKIQQLEKTGLPILTMPSVEELVSGEAHADEIRDVSIVDILGRSEVTANTNLMVRRVTGRCVLVTGGGGSIGSELCRQVMRLAPSKLVILDSCEANLYHITEELNLLSVGPLGSSTPPFVPILGTVTDKARVERMMAKHSVDTIFHAAAYKHVPIVEAQPDQGVEINIFGTVTVLDAAIEAGASDFVLISTDKAVRPTNAMGASKRVAELVLQAKAAQKSDTRISMVRFGNVLGSSGSVVPKFKRQILEGGPITLTHTEVTRFFMTIPEAAQLVLQASAIAKGGDVFVLDMGEPVKIADLARTMVRLYGKELAEDTGRVSDIQIQVQGLRPGEKLYEELFISKNGEPTEVAKITTSTEVWLEWEVLSETLLRLKLMDDYAAINGELMKLAFIGENVHIVEDVVKNSTHVGSGLEAKAASA